MQLVKIKADQTKSEQDKRYQWLERALYAVFFLAAFFLCTTIKYSDGDDAYFYGMAHSMGFFEYLKMRYITWEGRMTSEAMTYLAMYFGKGFWNAANAAVMTLLAGGLTQIAAGICKDLTQKQKTMLTAVMCVGISLMGVGVIGYAGFWITGSTFYLWSVTAGVWAAVPLAKLAFSPKTLRKRSFLYAVPCGFIAAMGLEQITAVVIAFTILAVIYHFVKEKEVYWPAVVLAVVMIAGLSLLFISPGTDARSGQEAQWMPEFATMSAAHHIFITGQWILSGFANYHKIFISVILILVAVLFLERRQAESKSQGTETVGRTGKAAGESKTAAGESKTAAGESGKAAGKVWKAAAVIAAVAGTLSSWISCLGINIFSELGMGVQDEMIPVTKTATLGSLSGQELFACLFQLLLIGTVLVLLWKAGGSFLEKAVLALLLLASQASAAVMYFSPTMYASGPRVMFVTAVLLWLIMGVLFAKVKNPRIRIALFAYMLAAGGANMVCGYLLM